MSFWSKLGVVVRDLNVFKAVCEKHNIEYEDVAGCGVTNRGHVVQARLNDRQSGGPRYSRTAFLVEDGGAFKVLIDGDAGYSSLTKRLGKNGGLLMRDYTQQTVEKSIRNQGGTILNRVENPDGSVVLKMVVNG